MPTQSKFRNYSATLDHMGYFMREMIKKTTTLVLIMIAVTSAAIAATEKVLCLASSLEKWRDCFLPKP